MLNIKHTNGQLYKILGFENEEALDKAIVEDNTITSDLKVFMSVFMAASEAPELSAVLSIVTGLKLGRPSEVAEYVLKNTTDEDQRRELVQNLMVIKIANMMKTDNKSDALSMLLDMVGKKE